MTMTSRDAHQNVSLGRGARKDTLFPVGYKSHTCA